MLRNRVTLRRAGGGVEMRVAGASFSVWHPRHLMTGLAWDALSAACLLRPTGPPASVLLLGLGGGTVVRQLKALVPGVRITAVELDARVVALARRHMRLDRLGVETIVDDAFAVVARERRRFDAVIDDLYVTGPEDVWRPRPPDRALLRQYRARVVPGGLVIVNLVTGVGHRRVQTLVRSAMRSVFPLVRSVRPPEGFNEALVGGVRVGSRRLLAPYETRLSGRRDRALWKRIAVAGLRDGAAPADPGE